MPRYKRPPITEAVVEVRIATSIAMATVGRVRDRLKEYYPLEGQLRATNVEIGETTARVLGEQLQGYRLTAADGASIVSVTTQSVSTSRLPPYDGWESFITDARRNWEIWKRVVGWQKIARVGVRYLNRLDVPTEAPVSVDDYLTFTIKGPPLDLPPMHSFAIQEARPLGKDHCQLVLNAGLVPSPLIRTMSLLLDIDVSRMDELPQNDEGLWAFVDRVREYKNLIFEACITDRARELFDR